MMNDASLNNFDNSKKISFSGANMMSKAYESALIEGVPEISGGEDPEFGKRLETIGKIGFIEGAVTYLYSRLSARTAEDAGHGQRMLRYKRILKRGGVIKIEANERIIFEENAQRGLDILLKKGGVKVDDLKNILSIDGVLMYKEEEFEFLVDKFNNVRSVRDLDMRTNNMAKMLKKFEDTLDRYFPKIKVEVAAMELLKKLRRDEHIETQFVKNRDNFIAKLEKSYLNNNSDSELLKNLKILELNLDAMEKTIKEIMKMRTP